MKFNLNQKLDLCQMTRTHFVGQPLNMVINPETIKVEVDADDSRIRSYPKIPL